jgi:EpsI family protein
VAVLVIAIAATAPYLQAANLERAAQPLPLIGMPALAGPWSGPRPADARWRAATPAGAVETSAEYAGARSAAEVAILRFGRRADDAEMVGSASALVATSAAQILDTGRANAELGGDRSIPEMVLRVGSDYRVVWHWYRIGGTLVVDDWYAKVLEAWHALLYGHVDAALVVVSVQAADAATAREALGDFVVQAWPAIERCLDMAVAGCPDAPR